MKSTAIPIYDFIRQRAAKLKCMKYCLGCEKELRFLDTPQVWPVQIIDEGKQKTRFYCDKCKEENEG